MKVDETGTLPRKLFEFDQGEPAPTLLVAYSPSGVASTDHQTINDTLTTGRAGSSDLKLLDYSISRSHFRITTNARRKKTIIEDLGSKNGTYVNGREIKRATVLRDQAVIRAGRVLMVYLADARPVLGAQALHYYGIVGKFHAAALVSELDDAVRSGRNLLLTGPSGSGKELAALAVARMAGRELSTHNAARFTSEEEATTSLFGVAEGVFTSVKERAGYIEEAEGGVLFLDEAHNLPVRVQKSLLRVLEDGWLARFGETTDIKVDVRFVLASNEPPKKYGLTRDLLARLRVQEIPGLAGRIADIPGIFDHLLEQAIKKAGLPVMPFDEALSEDHYESLMLDGFKEDNVRGLDDLADRIVSKVKTGATLAEATGEIFSRRYHTEFMPDIRPETGVAGQVTGEIPRPSSTLNDEQQNVHDAYKQVSGNVSAIERLLRDKGIDYSRRRISGIMDQLDLPRVRKG